MNDLILVLSTCKNIEETEKIARALLDKRLAACVNITPTSSLYVWHGNIEKAEEQILIIKTTSKLFKQVEEQIRRVHSYKVPEIISVKVDRGAKPYLDWIAETCGEAESKLRKKRSHKSVKD